MGTWTAFAILAMFLTTSLISKVLQFQLYFSLQASTFCVPQHESCVSNQTLKNDYGLVTCDGLYADITDDSLQQENMALQEKTTVLQYKLNKGVFFVFTFFQN